MLDQNLKLGRGHVHVPNCTGHIVGLAHFHGKSDSHYSAIKINWRKKIL